MGSAGPVHPQVQVAGTLQPQAGVAHLVGMGRQVRAVGKQLVVTRRPLGQGQIAGQLPARRQRPQAAKRVAARREAAVGRHKARHRRATLGCHGHRFQARAKAETAPTGAQLLMCKQGTLPGVAVGRKGFIAIGRKTALLQLQADDAVQRTPAGLAGLQPQVLPTALEQGAGHRPVKLGVLVHAATDRRAHRLKRTGQAAQFTVQRIALSAHANRDRILGHRAVLAAETADRRTEPAPLKKHRSA